MKNEPSFLLGVIIGFIFGALSVLCMIGWIGWIEPLL